MVKPSADSSVKVEQEDMAKPSADSSVKVEQEAEQTDDAATFTADTNESIKIEGGDENDNENDNEKEDNDETKKKRKRKRPKKASAEETAASALKAASFVSSGSQSADLNCTVYIEGLPYESTEEDVTAFFTSFSVPVVSMKLARWQDTSRLRGYGHVVVQSESLVNKAINAMSNKCLPNQTRFVTLSKALGHKCMSNSSPKAQPSGCTLVFVKNLPYEVTEDEMKEAFSACGKLTDNGVRLATNQNGQLKGFGFVEYRTAEGAQTAVNQASKPFGLTVKGRPVYVDYEEGKPKNSFRTTEGRSYNKVHKVETAGGKKKQRVSGPKLNY